MKNRLLIFLIAFLALMGAVYSMASACMPQPAQWVTVSLPDPPKPLPDPAMTAAARSPSSDLGGQHDSN